VLLLDKRDATRELVIAVPLNLPQLSWLFAKHTAEVLISNMNYRSDL
jgi:hypothetical protein